MPKSLPDQQATAVSVYRRGTKAAFTGISGDVSPIRITIGDVGETLPDEQLYTAN